MRRKYTDGDKWDDGWFTDLSATHKLVWLYLCDRADCAGLVKINLRMIEMHTGASRTDWSDFVNQAGEGRIQFAADDVVWIVKYIPFQVQSGFTINNPVVKGMATRLCRYRLPLDMLPGHYHSVLAMVMNSNHFGGARKPLTRDYQAKKEKEEAKEEEEAAERGEG
jgi:hypothetical protein